MTNKSESFTVQCPRGESQPYNAPLVSAAAAVLETDRVRAGQSAWAAMGIAGRVSVLQRWRAALVAEADALADALRLDTGRSLLSQVEVDGSLRKLDAWCERAPQLFERSSSGQSFTAPTVDYEHQWVPLGVVAVISPWNFPLLLTLTDAIPALLAGCAVVAKPSEITPRFVAPLQRSIAAVPELAEVFSVLTGLGETGAAVVSGADAVCFTGSVETGRKVGAQAGGLLIPAFLELGGKDPLLILEDANLDQAVTVALRASVVSTGQACQSIERIYVHESFYSAFVEKLVAQAALIELNMERIDEGHLGPFIDVRLGDKVQAQIEEAVAQGATLHCGGVVRRGGAAWCAPAVLTQVNHDMLLYREETFGPVLPVMSFADDAQAIAMANDTPFGLSAAVLGERSHATEVARALRAGAVSVNDGGLTTAVSDVEKESFGQSGVGRSRMGDSGLLRCLRIQALLIQNAAPAPLDAFREVPRAT